MYAALGACLILASLMAINVLGTQLVELIWRFCKRYVDAVPADSRAGLLFGLRVLPVLGALSIGLFILFPAYVFYEPRQTTERVPFILAVAAFVSALGLANAAYRGVQRYFITRRLLKSWLSRSTRLPGKGLDIPAYHLDHPHPVVALSGILRPRMFIARCVLETLSKDELDAVITHERAHHVQRHNLMRAVLRTCADLLPGISCGRALDREWSEISEQAADEFAGRPSPEASLQLASALIRTARLAPSGVKLAVPASVSLAANANVANRVRRLVELASADAPPEIKSLAPMQRALVASPFFFSLWVLADPERLRAAHRLIELIVTTLR